MSQEFNYNFVDKCLRSKKIAYLEKGLFCSCRTRNVYKLTNVKSLSFVSYKPISIGVAVGVGSR